MVFINSSELAKHQMAVHEEKMFQCQSCNEVLANEQEFRRHTIGVHGKL